jgi:hypothetical protein
MNSPVGAKNGSPRRKPRKPGGVDSELESPAGAKEARLSGTSPENVFRPVRGWVTLVFKPQACAWGYYVTPLRGYQTR